MKGRNTLSLCPAQMIESVQEWVDRNFASKPKVTDVSFRGSSTTDRSFEVSLSDEPRTERARSAAQIRASPPDLRRDDVDGNMPSPRFGEA